jgi:hypothetical protein
MMKHYLLTWYGITDLRAAFGFEEFDGPVLGALKTGEFTDVMILAYTDPSKETEQTAVDLKALQNSINSARSVGESISRQKQTEAIDTFANTPAAHQVYKAWLKEEIRGLGSNIGLRMCIKELAYLNDAKGIYDAAIQALEIVSSTAGEKDVTFYLSPGTPVMAFTWAFVSMTNPELNIKVIASSQFRKPPEVVQLPYELLAPSSRKPRNVELSAQNEFEAVFHLFGEQRMPSLLGILQFPSKHHIFVTSEKYSAEIMRQFLPHESGWDQILVNPFDPMSTKIGILQKVSSFPTCSRIGFNLTGGTKLMFAGATAACRKIGGIPFYFETRDHSLIFLHDFSKMEMRGIDEVDLFFRANGFAVVGRGKWEDNSCRRQRKSLTHRLWKDRGLIAKVYRQMSQYADYDGDQFIPFHLQETIYIKGESVFVEIDLDQTGKAYINLGGAEFKFKHSPDFAKYLAGKWLEEYTYLILEPLLIEGKIRDLRIGLEVNWDSPSDRQSDSPIQEFDVAFTGGKRLFIVECKAGAVFSDDVYKLQHCVRNYGGIDACGIMVCAFPPHHAQTRKRLESASHLNALYGWDIPKHLADLVLGDSW